MSNFKALRAPQATVGQQRRLKKFYPCPNRSSCVRRTNWGGVCLIFDWTGAQYAHKRLEGYPVLIKDWRTLKKYGAGVNKSYAASQQAQAYASRLEKKLLKGHSAASSKILRLRSSSRRAKGPYLSSYA